MTPTQERLELIADDALAVDSAAIILDDLERLLGYVSGSADGGSASLAMSHGMLEKLLSLLRRQIPSGGSLLVIGTTSHYELLSRTPLLAAFDTHVQLPGLHARDNVRRPR